MSQDFDYSRGSWVYWSNRSVDPFERPPNQTALAAARASGTGSPFDGITIAAEFARMRLNFMAAEDMSFGFGALDRVKAQLAPGQKVVVSIVRRGYGNYEIDRIDRPGRVILDDPKDNRRYIELSGPPADRCYPETQDFVAVAKNHELHVVQLDKGVTQGVRGIIEGPTNLTNAPWEVSTGTLDAETDSRIRRPLGIP